MNARTVRLAWVVVIVAILCCVTTCASTAEQQNGSPPPADLAAMAIKAKADFRPLTASDVQAAKETLIKALDRLDRRLTAAGQNGKAWREYVRWGELKNELQATKQPDKTLLIGVYQRYTAGHDGLELVWFLDVQHALRNYIAVLNAVDNPQIRAAYEEQIDKLATSLGNYARRPTTEDALVISEAVRWLESAGQAPALLAAIQNKYVKPNVLGAVSAAIVGAGLTEAVDDTTPIRDCILGTDIYGTAHTVGQTSVELPPHPELGVIDTLFFGNTASDNVGYHGPVTIYSSAATGLAARKRLWIHAGGLAAHPADSNAVTAVDIHDIQSNKGRQMIERMAWKRACKQQGQVECIASGRAEQRLNKRIDQQADEALQRANQAYRDKFYTPFTERKLFPQVLRYSTTPEAIRLVALQAGGGKLAAPADPPAPVAEAEMSLCLHESAINNLAFDALAGRTVYEEKVQAAAVETLGHLPDKMKGDEDGKPWAITFAPRQPISVTFADDGFRVTLRGVKFYKGNDAHPGMNVSAAYKIVQTEKGFKAVRQGEIEVLPPDFVPGGEVKIDARRQVIRKLLEKRFAKVFEPEFLGEGLELPGKWKSAGKLMPIQVVARDGWLTIAWRRATAEPPAAK